MLNQFMGMMNGIFGGGGGFNMPNTDTNKNAVVPSTNKGGFLTHEEDEEDQPPAK